MGHGDADRPNYMSPTEKHKCIFTARYAVRAFGAAGGFLFDLTWDQAFDDCCEFANSNSIAIVLIFAATACSRKASFDMKVKSI